MSKIKSISIMFPLYNDKNTVELMITKSLSVLKKLKKKYEIIIVDTSKKKLNNSKILVLGVSYKKNSDDMRESPSIKIISILKKFNCKIFFSDPFFKNKLKLKILEQKIPAKGIVLNAKNLKKFDASILVTDHDNFNYNLIKKYSKIIIDCRNRFKKKLNKIYLA